MRGRWLIKFTLKILYQMNLMRRMRCRTGFGEHEDENKADSPKLRKSDMIYIAHLLSLTVFIRSNTRRNLPNVTAPILNKLIGTKKRLDSSPSRGSHATNNIT